MFRKIAEALSDAASKSGKTVSALGASGKVKRNHSRLSYKKNLRRNYMSKQTTARSIFNSYKKIETYFKALPKNQSQYKDGAFEKAHEASLYRDEDYKKETTTFVFEDGSRLRFHSSSFAVVRK